MRRPHLRRRHLRTLRDVLMTLAFSADITGLLLVAARLLNLDGNEGVIAGLLALGMWCLAGACLTQWALEEDPPARR